MNRAHRRLVVAVEILTLALALAGVAGLARAQAVDPPSFPGVMLEQAGVRFLVPNGFELSPAQVDREEGPANVVLLEPQGGVVSGHPNAGFLVISIYRFEITPEEAIAELVADISRTYARSGDIDVSDDGEDVEGAGRHWIRLDFQLADVALVGRVTSFREGERTVVIYQQGRAQDLEELADVFHTIAQSIGVEN